MLACKKGYGCKRRPMTFFGKLIHVFIFVILVPIAGMGQPAKSSIGSPGNQKIRSTTLPNESHQVYQALWEKVEQGFIFASVDTVHKSGDTIQLEVNPGSKYRWSRGSLRQLHEGKKKLRKLANQGYPFAQVRAGSLQIQPGQVNAEFQVAQGPFIVFDSVRVFGPLPFSNRFLGMATGVLPGRAYSERVFQGINQRIDRLPQVSLLSRPDVGFHGGSASVILQVAAEKSDRFEGILGILPSTTGTTQVTGYLNLQLGNLFRSGKSFSFDWNRFAESSQTLNLTYKHPFLLASPLFVETQFVLLRQDSVFVKRDFKLGFEYLGSAGWSFSLALSSRASDLLTSEPNPQLGLDFRNTEFRPGVSYGTNQYFSSFRKALYSSLSIGIGDKRVLENPNFDRSVYDSTNLKTTNIQIDFELLGQWKLGGRQAYFSHLEFGSIGGQEVLRNEYYRLGGLNSLRGFNENVFFARQFLVFRSEYRLFFEEESYAFALTDIGFLDLEPEWASTTSLGAGLAFNTQSGTFKFIFAMGAVDGLEFLVQETKVHFGYSIVF